MAKVTKEFPHFETDKKEVKPVSKCATCPDGEVDNFVSPQVRLSGAKTISLDEAKEAEAELGNEAQTDEAQTNEKDALVKEAEALGVKVKRTMSVERIKAIINEFKAANPNE